jgi:hypothetical protein
MSTTTVTDRLGRCYRVPKKHPVHHLQNRYRKLIKNNIITENKLQRRADLQRLSAFPNESEVLFPSLTYMQSEAQSTGRKQVADVHGYR